MKNYYLQLSELNVAKTRLSTLEAKKQMYLRRVTSTVSVIKDIVVVGGKAPNKMDEYVIKCEEIDKEILELKEEITLLENNLKAMDEYMKASVDKADTEYQVFVQHYIEGKKADEIAQILPCGIATVYRKLKKLEKLLKNDSK
jgi:hypothetical protein